MTVRWGFGWITVGALFLGLAVALGAVGAHLLGNDAEALRLHDKAIRYQVIHGLGLLLIGNLSLHFPGRLLNLAASALTAGTLCFAGSLLALAWHLIAQPIWITPLGGVLFLIGWTLLAGWGVLCGARQMRSH